VIRFKLVNPGCSASVLNKVSELDFKGNIKNLSQFTIPLENWNSVKLINHKHVKLYLNNKLLFEGTYKVSLGEVRGLFIEFHGNGFIKNCELKTYDGKVLYHF
jgi:hypothetical protein